MNDSYLLLYYTFVRGFFCNICVIAFNKSVSRFETHCSVVKVCVITPLVLGQNDGRSECSGSLRIPPL